LFEGATSGVEDRMEATKKARWTAIVGAHGAGASDHVLLAEKALREVGVQPDSSCRREKMSRAGSGST